jgi:DNA-directed RNA polymerase subunit RPC12/RpoP
VSVGLEDTMSVSLHKCGLPVMVRRKYRCAGCGHRLTVNGVAPVQTRRQRPWVWHIELIDRRTAKRLTAA